MPHERRAWSTSDDEGTGLFFGATAYILAKAFASGGAAVTGVEAISNGVPAFQPAGVEERPRHAGDHGRRAWPSCSSACRSSPRRSRSPRSRRARRPCSSRSARRSTASSGLGEAMSGLLNVATMLILVLAANTGFADFPRLASLQASDSFLPRQLTKRGHRLVFSNGILALAGVAAVLVVLTGAAVTRADPALRHLGVHRLHAVAGRHDQATTCASASRASSGASSPTAWAACCRSPSCCIVVITRFPDAWPILPIMPLFVIVLIRLNRQYEVEGQAAGGRRARRGQGADPAAPRRAGVRRPARRRHRPGHPVRPHADARRACGPCTSWSTRTPGQSLGRRVAPPGPGPGAARAGGLPRPADGAHRGRDRRP